MKKELEVVICHAIQRYTKANNKYMKNYDKKKESPYIIYPIFRCKQFAWMGNVSKIEDFIKNYDEDSDKG